MKILIACEESGTETAAFRELGYQAFSCDLKPTTGKYPQYHIVGDVLDILQDNWDLMIAHPPCTYLSNAGNRSLYSKFPYDKERYLKGLEARKFFFDLYNAPIKRIAIENPVPNKIYGLPRPDQIINPYNFGEPYSKRTCLWLKNLPPLYYTDIVLNYKSFTLTRHGSEARSKSFPGIARAMATQWGDLI